jgi:hypothetical protein
MMTSGAEVEAMLAAARAERESPSETPVEPDEPTPDYAAPTMMTSGAEVEAMLHEARATADAQPEKPASSETDTPDETSAVKVFPLEEAPLEEVPMDLFSTDEGPVDMPEPVSEPPSPYDPTMISALPDEVAEAIAAAKLGEYAAEPLDEPLAEPPTPFSDFPDPLGMSDSEGFPASDAEPVNPPPPPVYHEPAAPPPPEAPKDNRKWWIIGGVGCVGLCCLCSLVVVVVNLIPVIANY